MTATTIVNIVIVISPVHRHPPTTKLLLLPLLLLLLQAEEVPPELQHCRQLLGEVLRHPEPGADLVDGKDTSSNEDEGEQVCRRHESLKFDRQNQIAIK